ncbi:Cell wall beta-glucan synthesis [Penicillium griseofulvum]|uniref:Cell wall beta-glucan synthesis n=1 Tax=Penicillium patulum TaxID=5078 RepID=A0A135LGU8_PENPA|nr:Cell wall beta-glucan synthesis [Penicillium griseofulvum]KXG48207.1 Cell wall beta-glucan synthesis [Penicillium griseofulvum]
MRINIISLVALAATASALLVTSPQIGEKIDPEMPLTIKWQTVATDPDTFTIQLVNQNVYPPTTEVVVEDVDSSKGSYTVKAKTFTGVDDGKGYQINFISPTSGILAQSQQFGVTEPGAIASSSGKETSTALETSSALESSSALETSSLSLMSSTASATDLTSTPSATASSLSSTATHSSSVRFFLHYIHYPNYFLHYRFYITYIRISLDSKHNSFHIPFYPIHYPCIVRFGNGFVLDHVNRNPFNLYFHHSPYLIRNLLCYGVGIYHECCGSPHATCWKSAFGLACFGSLNPRPLSLWQPVSWRSWD